MLLLVPKNRVGRAAATGPDSHMIFKASLYGGGRRKSAGNNDGPFDGSGEMRHESSHSKSGGVVPLKNREPLINSIKSETCARKASQSPLPSDER